MAAEKMKQCSQASPTAVDIVVVIPVVKEAAKMAESLTLMSRTALVVFAVV